MELPCPVFLSLLTTANGQNESSKLCWASRGPPVLVRDRPVRRHFLVSFPFETERIVSVPLQWKSYEIMPGKPAVTLFCQPAVTHMGSHNPKPRRRSSGLVQVNTTANRYPGPSPPALLAAPRNDGNLLSSHCRLSAEDHQGALGIRSRTAFGREEKPCWYPHCQGAGGRLRAARESPPMRIPAIVLHHQCSGHSSPRYTETTKFRVGEVIPKPLEIPFRWKNPIQKPNAHALQPSSLSRSSVAFPFQDSCCAF